MRETVRLKKVVLLCLLGFSPFSSAQEVCWQDRVLPLPKEMDVSGRVTARAGDIRYRFQAKGDDPVFATVRELFDSFAKGEGENGAVTLTLVRLDEFPAAIPGELARRLGALPNAAQAYAIFPRGDAELVLAAPAPAGLLYAAYTVHQLVTAGHPDIAPETRVEIPRARIVDWPDVAFRGSRAPAAYNSFGWNAQWKLNQHFLRLNTSRGGHRGKGKALPPTDIHYLADIGTERFREWTEWANELGYRCVPGIDHLGILAAHGLKGISPAVYTEEHPAPRYSTARGFCWAEGQEIYTVLEEEMRKAASISSLFLQNDQTIEVLLTEHVGTSCYCPECNGESGYVMEARGVLKIFQKLRKEMPGLKLILVLGQGGRPVHDRIMELVSAVPGAGVGHYDGVLTYRTDRVPMIPDWIESFARTGGFVDVVTTLIPGHWDTQVPGSLPSYVRHFAREFVEKKMQSASHYDMVGAQFYWPLTIAAWGEYLWNANGRSVTDFARAYATITGRADPDLFARWADKAGAAAWELGVSQYAANIGRAQYSFLPRLLEDDAPQELNTLRLGRALGDAAEAVDLAREAGNEEMRMESAFTFAVLKSIPLRREIGEAIQSEEDRAAAAEKLDQLDTCAQLALAAAYAWHDRAAKNREALAQAPGVIRPPELIPQLPWGRDRGRTVPHITQWRPWYGLLHVSDRERMKAVLVGWPDTRGEFAPEEIAFWEKSDFKGRRLSIRRDVTEAFRPAGGSYVLEFNTLEGSGSAIRMVLTGTREGTGETRIVSRPDPIWDMRARDARDSFYTYLFRVPERAAGEKFHLEVTLTSLGDGGGSSGYLTLRRVRAWEEFSKEPIDAWFE